MGGMRRDSLPDQVFATLAGAILSGRYAPRERLPTQRELARELGVNVASVREGIKRLEQLKLVEVRHGDAMRVRDWRESGGLDVLLYAAEHAGTDILAPLFEARRILFAEAARLAAKRRTDAQALRLLDLVDELAAAPDDAHAQELDWAFFSTVVEASGNLVLLLVTNSIRDLYFARLEQFRAIVTERRELIRLYRRTASGIAKGEAGRAAGGANSLASLQEARILGKLP
jgi:GntR family transcriptional regulator, transcriptional repressor for pyruvate dehydrogenase complex